MADELIYLGLCEEAKEFLYYNVQAQLHNYKSAKKDVILNQPVQENIGKFGDNNQYDLVKYLLKDGTWAEEYVQTQRWIRKFFLALGLRVGDVCIEHTYNAIRIYRKKHGLKYNYNLPK